MRREGGREGGGLCAGDGLSSKEMRSPAQRKLLDYYCRVLFISFDCEVGKEEGREGWTGKKEIDEQNKAAH